jgi:hypothetical protein
MQRSWICPMEIIEQDDDWSIQTGPLNESGDSIEEAKPRRFRVKLRGRFEARKAIFQLRNHLGKDRCEWSYFAIDSTGLELLDETADDLDPGPEGRCPLSLTAAPHQHRGSAHSSQGSEFLCRPRLSDSCIAREQDRLRNASEAPIEGRRDCSELDGAPDESGVMVSLSALR